MTYTLKRWSTARRSLTHAVLERGARETQLVLAVQREDGLGGGAVAVLDAVRLVQHYAPPLDLDTDTPPTVNPGRGRSETGRSTYFDR